MNNEELSTNSLRELDPVKAILCTYLSSDNIRYLITKIENDCIRLYQDDIVIREICPYETKRVKCFFEDRAYYELTNKELEILLKALGTSVYE